MGGRWEWCDGLWVQGKGVWEREGLGWREVGVEGVCGQRLRYPEECQAGAVPG